MFAYVFMAFSLAACSFLVCEGVRELSGVFAALQCETELSGLWKDRTESMLESVDYVYS